MSVRDFSCIAYDDAPFGKGKEARASFQASKRAEKQFGAQLRSIARHIADMIWMTFDGSVRAIAELERWAARYSETLDAWARAAVHKMHVRVAISEWRAWKALSQEIGAGLKAEVANAPVGAVFQVLMDDQVKLIKSLPTEAARRVHEITIKALTEGVRHEDLIGLVRQLGDMTRARATLIARTETARTASTLTEARATYAGSVAYVWRTAGDAQVRPSHRMLEGKVCMWNDPPVSDVSGGVEHRSHPGRIWNCRCYAQPLFFGAK
jgi:SPP1 gp7 family putative phage head morphogenesis protein